MINQCVSRICFLLSNIEFKYKNGIYLNNNNEIKKKEKKKRENFKRKSKRNEKPTKKN